MKPVIFNGSPRGEKSNTKILMDKFSQGYGSKIEAHYLNRTKNNSAHLEAFQDADTVILAFPLYTDAMPGIVKYFIESLAGIPVKNHKKIGYLVHSGFPEAKHSVYIERYLQKLTQRLHCTYLGTIIKGGTEGIQIQPASMTRKLFQVFHDLGSSFQKTGKFEENIINKLRRPYMLPFFARTLLRFLCLSGIINFYWNYQLKANKAFNDRFAAPYGPPY